MKTIIKDEIDKLVTIISYERHKIKFTKFKKGKKIINKKGKLIKKVYTLKIYNKDNDAIIQFHEKNLKRINKILKGDYYGKS